MSFPVPTLLLFLAAAPAPQDPPPVSLDDLLRLEAHLERLTPRLQEVTVGLRLGGAQGGAGSASGVLVSEDGLVLTVAHAFGSPGQRLQVVLHDGRTLPGETLGRESRRDFALVRILDGGPFPFAEIGRSEDLLRRQILLCAGHPGGIESGRPPVVRLGTLGERRRDWLITSCVLMPGDSGGPLFDLEGRVVGVNSRIEVDERINYHVPVERYLDAWEALVAGEDLSPSPFLRRGRPMLGAELSDHPEGVRVNRVQEGGPAAAAGLQAGDILTHLDGDRLHGRSSIRGLLRTYERGEEAVLRVRRGSRILRLPVILGVWGDEEPGDGKSPPIPLPPTGDGPGPDRGGGR